MTGLVPRVRFPDTDLWLAAYLRTALADATIRISTDYREIGSGKAVWIRKDGGTSLTIVTAAIRYGINVYAPDPTGEAVNDLTEDVRSLIAASPGDGPCKAIGNLTWPISVDDVNGIPRRYFTFEATIKGSNQ